jgi:hypothetical protein
MNDTGKLNTRSRQIAYDSIHQPMARMLLLSTISRRLRLLGGLSIVIAGCVAPKAQRKPAVAAEVSADSATTVIREALVRALAIQDSAIWRRVVFRGDTAWAMVTADSLVSHRARLERRNGLWVFVRFDGTAVR